MTPDQRSSGAFFRHLLGWGHREVDAGPFGAYTLFQKDGEDVAGMMNATPALGGKMLVAPHDVPEFGRVCAVADPSGAVAHLVQPKGQ